MYFEFDAKLETLLSVSFVFFCKQDFETFKLMKALEVAQVHVAIDGVTPVKLGRVYKVVAYHNRDTVHGVCSHLNQVFASKS